uniref:Uncharacterized protein n=1 Tax=Arundo donax TaxID=35708 RepID=A0A0A9B4N7_ARUDO
MSESHFHSGTPAKDKLYNFHVIQTREKKGSCHVIHSGTSK